MEPSEMQEFTEQMEKGGETALRHVSFIISVLAVLVAMITVLGHRTHTEAILLQTRAADQWNQYQAKKIRQTQVTGNAELLSLQPSSDDAAVQKKLGEYRAHLEKWNDELTEEQHKAEELEADVKTTERRADRYDISEALLQIAVVLSSITLLTRSRSYVIFGMVLGGLGLVLAIAALLLH